MSSYHLRINWLIVILLVFLGLLAIVATYAAIHGVNVHHATTIISRHGPLAIISRH